LKIKYLPDRILDNVNNSDRTFLSTKTVFAKGDRMKSVAVAVVFFVAFIIGCSNPGKSVAPAVPQAQEVSNVKVATNSVDYLVVYGDQLHDAAASFAAYRKSSSRSTAIVAYGAVASAFPSTASNRPMRGFFNYVNTSWTHAPKQVLLLGDAGVHGIPFADTLVFSDSSYQDSGTYSDAGTDSLLTFSIGRIPCSTNDQALAVLDKIKNFEAALPNKVRFIVDNPITPDPLTGSFLDAFHAISPLINGTLYSQDSFMVRKFGNDTTMWTDSESHQAKTTLFQFLNSGNGYVSYIGYSAASHLSYRDLLNVSDMASLSAINAYVLSSSFAADVTRDTLLARSMLLQQDGGAVAVIGNSYYQYVTDEERFQSGFFSGLTQGKYATLGDLFKAAVQNNIANKTKLLLGDPAMKIRR
jgi:hypothetical protein